MKHSHTGWSTEKVGANYMIISPRIAAERLRAGKRRLIRGGEGGQPPESVMHFDPRTLVVVVDYSPLPGLRWVCPRWILMAAGAVIRNMFVFLCHRGLLSGRCLDWPAAGRHDSLIGSLLTQSGYPQ